MFMHLNECSQFTFKFERIYWLDRAKAMLKNECTHIIGLFRWYDRDRSGNMERLWQEVRPKQINRKWNGWKLYAVQQLELQWNAHFDFIKFANFHHSAFCPSVDFTFQFHARCVQMAHGLWQSFPFSRFIGVVLEPLWAWNSAFRRSLTSFQMFSRAIPSILYVHAKGTYIFDITYRTMVSNVEMLNFDLGKKSQHIHKLSSWRGI